MLFATIATVIGAPFLVSFWGLFCTDKAYRQRQELIEAIFTDANYAPDLARFSRVPFEKHMWALFFFRNPYDLY